MAKRKAAKRRAIDVNTVCSCPSCKAKAEYLWRELGSLLQAVVEDTLLALRVNGFKRDEIVVIMKYAIGRLPE